MIARPRTFVVLLGMGVAAGAVVIARHARAAMGQTAPGGILVRDAALYDALSHRLLLGSLTCGGASIQRGALAIPGRQVRGPGAGEPPGSGLAGGHPAGAWP